MRWSSKPLIAVFIVIVIFLIAKFTLSNSIGDKLLERIRGTGSRTSQDIVSTEAVRHKTASSFNEVRMIRSLSDYRVIVENDLLRPLGWQKNTRVAPPPEPVVQRETRRERPEAANDLVLTGIVNLGEESIALVEDISRGQAYFLREGDRLKNYIVEAIAEDNIVLVNGGSKTMAVLGSKTSYNSSGLISSTGERTMENSPEAMDKGSASSDEGSDELSIIDRMKARRRKELEQE